MWPAGIDSDMSRGKIAGEVHRGTESSAGTESERLEFGKVVKGQIEAQADAHYIL